MGKLHLYSRLSFNAVIQAASKFSSWVFKHCKSSFFFFSVISSERKSVVVVILGCTVRFFQSLMPATRFGRCEPFILNNHDKTVSKSNYQVWNDSAAMAHFVLKKCWVSSIPRAEIIQHWLRSRHLRNNYSVHPNYAVSFAVSQPSSGENCIAMVLWKCTTSCQLICGSITLQYLKSWLVETRK